MRFDTALFLHPRAPEAAESAFRALLADPKVENWRRASRVRKLNKKNLDHPAASANPD